MSEPAAQAVRYYALSQAPNMGWDKEIKREKKPFNNYYIGWLVSKIVGIKYKLKRMWINGLQL